MKKKKLKFTEKNKNKIKEIIIIIIIFLIIFSLSLYSILKIINKKNLEYYHNISFFKKNYLDKIFYEGVFYDNFGEKFTYRFFNNPYTLEEIKINGKIELKKEVMIFADDVDKCENFYENAIGFSVFLQKVNNGSVEVRSIQGINFSNYDINKTTIIYLRKVGILSKLKIEKIEEGYIIYIKNCEIEKSFERFLLGAYLNKKDIILNNQIY
ncbi:MAG: hypothetical protein QW117_01890 [Candidatus Pacearchaeota archaeon]